MAVSSVQILVRVFLLTISLQCAEPAVSFSFLPATTSITETSVIGTTVFSLYPTGGVASYTCSISFQDPNNSLQQFTINSLNVETILEFDYEAVNNYVLTIECVDSMAVTGTSTLTVSIMDINDESPVITGALNGSINEEMSPGSPVAGLFSATDPDTSDVLSYFLTGSDTSYFQIDPSSGTISVKTELDRDAVAARTVFNQLNLIVTDQAGASATASLTITLDDINDNTPTFSPGIYYVTVAENESPAVSLVTLTCSDPDLTGNGDITYAIASGDDASPKFTLSGNEVRTSTNPIDYESLSGQNFQYQLILTGTDGGTTPNTGSATVVVQVTGENDADPAWGVFTPPYVYPTTPYVIQEDVPIGTTVVTIQAADLDSGLDGVLSYSLTSTLDDSGALSPGLFMVETASGVVITTENLDRDHSASAYYDILLRASDHGTPPRSVDRPVRVGIQDVNDNAPIFGFSIYKVTQQENEAAGTACLNLIATDDDATSTLTYSIISGNDDSKFQISLANVLEIQTVIDLDVPNSDPSFYMLEILVVDGGTPELTGSTTVIITITPSNEFDPVFQTALGGTYMIAEDTAADSTILTIFATDDDYGINNTVTYSIFSGNPGDAFHLNSATGELKLMKEIDFDTLVTNPIELLLVATDGGGRSSTGTVTISLTDINDLNPSCASKVYYVSVSETITVGSDVYTLVCSNGEVAGSLTYLITSGNSGDIFTITATGVIQLNNGIDYESGTILYNLVIEVSDGFGNDTVQLTVSVLPVNEAVPVFSASTINVTWGEDTLTGSVLTTVTATDTDSTSHGSLTYTISNVSPNQIGLFRMDPTLGDLELLQELDYDGLPIGAKYYIVTITATDGGGLQATATVNVMVTDVNDNMPVCNPSFQPLTTPESTGGDSFPLSLANSLTCADIDEGVFGELTYNMAANPYGGLFSVDSGSGAVSLTGAVDYEAVNWYSFLVNVADGGTPTPKSTSITVIVQVSNLNDGPPVYTGPLSTSLLESAAIGQFVIYANASDPDPSDSPEGKLLYSIVSGDPGGDFSISKATGSVTVNKNLDLETQSFYQLEIEALEMEGTYSATTTLDVTLTDVNDNTPVCAFPSSDIIISENITVGEDIFTLTCTDADYSAAYSNIVYTIASGDTSKFEITGDKLSIKASLDYDSGLSSYDISVTASDGLNTQDVQLLVILTPVNEDGPIFTNSGYYSVVIGEDTLLGTVVIQVTANDTDEGSDGLVFYSMTVHPKFDLDPQTGELVLMDYLDRETEVEYSLTVMASDLGSPSRSSTATVSVTVSDANDNTPVCFPGSYSHSLPETATVGTSIISLNCSDQDLGVNADITFSIVNGNVGGVFAVENNAPFDLGEVTVNNIASLDYELNPFFDLIIQASDGGGRLTSAYVSVQITGYNDFAPVFVPVSSSTEHIFENVTIGSTIINLDATDGDSGEDGEITYSIVSSGLFTINSGTGEISVIGALDRESVTSYSFEILAVDGGTNPSALTATYSLTINIEDSNDITPMCTKEYYSIWISEDTAPLSLLDQQLKNCSDLDTDSPNNVLTYAVISGTGTANFDLDSSTGELYSASGSSFDRETVSNFELTVRVSDEGFPGFSTDVRMDIKLTDENDNTPQFCCSPYFVTVPRDVTIGASVFQLSANDTDAPPHGNVPTPSIHTAVYSLQGRYCLMVGPSPCSTSSDPNYVNDKEYDKNNIHYFGTVRYSIVSGNINNVFLIEPSTGIVRSQSFLYSQVSQYNLTVKAEDLGGPPLSSEAVLIVDAPTPPTCTSLFYYGNVLENASLSDYVLNVTCSDVDAFDVLTFSLITSSIPFAINSSSGVLTVDSTLDAESFPSYTFIVAVADSRYQINLTLTVDVIDVNEFTPVIDILGTYTVFVNEDILIGNEIVVVNATDTDVTNNTYFFITDGNVNFPFKINCFSGAIRINATLDFESLPVYELEVTVKDSFKESGLSSSVTLTVSLLDFNDNLPVCNPDFYDISLNETATGVITSILCTDADSVSPSLTYSITSGNTNNDFTVDENTGQVSVSATLDFENTTSYSIAVEVSDGLLSTVAHLLVAVFDVNEYDPVLTPSSQSVIISEDSPLVLSVLNVSATDEDGGDGDSIWYSIVSGNEESKFIVDGISGVLRLAASLDREQTDRYNLSIRASDRPSGSPDVRSQDVTVNVFISDINDNYPVFLTDYYLASIPESHPSNSSVLQVTATDADHGVNSYITYTIIAGNVDNIFHMIGRDVTIKAGKSLDYELTTSYSLNIMASDNGTDSKSSVTIVGIHVIAVNEFTPVFAGDDNVTIAENIAVGSDIYTATAVDNDTGIHGAVVYSIDLPNTSSTPFFIDSISGILKVWSRLDCDIGPSAYSLEIIAKDFGGNSSGLSSTMTLSVFLTDINDVTPTFSQTNYSFVVLENIVGDSYVGTTVASDADSGVYGLITYRIVMGNVEDFTINNVTGEIRTSVNSSFDYELKTDYFLLVSVTDFGSPPLSSSCFVHISLVNLNDNKPVFDPDNITVYINENATLSTSVSLLRAVDYDDISVNYTYSVLPSTHFSIGSISGVVTTSSTLDRESKSQHALTVTAVGNGSPVETAICLLTVVIVDCNDNPPVIHGIYDKGALETILPGTPVFTVMASDEDEGENSDLTFNITDTHPTNDFEIDSNSGLVLIANSLDRESRPVYYPVVVVSDHGAPPLSASVTLCLTVLDVNDVQPIFFSGNYTFEVAENATLGTSVGKIEAYDNDAGVNSALQYELVFFHIGAPHFIVNSISGDILTSSSLDREAVSCYTILCRALDSGTPGLSADTTVTITVTDVNDNAPQFELPFHKWELIENRSAGMDILSLTVTDADIGQNALITLSIDSSTANGTQAVDCFSVNSTEGFLVTKVSIDRETHSALSFVVHAVDSGGLPLTGSTTVSINILDINDNNPTFAQTFLSTGVAYDGTCSDLITTVLAVDEDQGLAALVYYYLVPSSNYFLFSVGEKTGEVRLRDEIKKNKTYILYISAKDNGVPSRSSASYLALRVDAFDPGQVSISFVLSVSKTYMDDNQVNFLHDLANIFRTKYPEAVPKMWCMEERDEFADVPTTRRRRSLPPREKAVTVHIYVLPDNKTDLINNYYNPKYFLPAQEALDFLLVGGNLDLSPPNALADANWTKYGILSVRLFVPLEETFSYISVVVVCSVLAVLLLTVLFVIIVKSVQAKRQRDENIALERMHNEENQLTPDQPSGTTGKVLVTPLQQRRISTSQSGPWKSNVKDAKTQTAKRGEKPQTRVDPVTGNLFQYDNYTKRLRWLSTTDGKPLNLRQLQDIHNRARAIKKDGHSKAEF